MMLIKDVGVPVKKPKKMVNNTTLEQTPKQNISMCCLVSFVLSGSDQQDYPGMRNIPQSTSNQTQLLIRCLKPLFPPRKSSYTLGQHIVPFNRCYTLLLIICCICEKHLALHDKEEIKSGYC